jgi:ABC-type transporter Mla subunit MlaD
MTYIYAAAGIAFALLLAAFFYERSEASRAGAERDQAVASLQVAVDANNAAQATIGRLRAQQEANDRIVAQLAGDVAEIRDTTDETQRAVGALKDEDPGIRDFLRTPIPAGLEQLLNGAGGGGGKAGSH